MIFFLPDVFEEMKIDFLADDADYGVKGLKEPLRRKSLSYISLIRITSSRSYELDSCLAEGRWRLSANPRS